MGTLKNTCEYLKTRDLSSPCLKAALLSLSLFFLFSLALFLDRGEASETEEQLPPVHMKLGAIMNSFAGMSLEDLKIAVNLIFKTRFEKKYPRHKGDMFLFSDLHAGLDAIKTNKINCLCLSTLDYLMTKEENNLIPVRNATLGETAKSRYLFLVRKEQQGTLESLKKKSLVLERGAHGDVAAVWLDTLLFERSLPESSRYFKSVEKMEKGSLGVMKLFFNKVDACIVQKNVYNVVKELNPQIGTDLQVLFESPEYLIGIFAISKDIDENTRKFILLYADELVEDMEGQKILSLIRVKGVLAFSPESMGSIEKLYDQYLRLKPVGR